MAANDLAGTLTSASHRGEGRGGWHNLITWTQLNSGSTKGQSMIRK